MIGYIVDRFRNFISRHKKSFIIYTIIFVPLFLVFSYFLYEETKFNLMEEDLTYTYEKVFKNLYEEVVNYEKEKNNNIVQEIEMNYFDEFGQGDNNHILKYSEFLRTYDIQSVLVETSLFKENEDSIYGLIKFRDFYTFEKEVINSNKFSNFEVKYKDNILYINGTNNKEDFEFLQGIYKKVENFDFVTYKEDISSNNSYVTLVLKNIPSAIISFFSIYMVITLILNIFKNFNNSFGNMLRTSIKNTIKTNQLKRKNKKLKNKKEVNKNEKKD